MHERDDNAVDAVGVERELAALRHRAAELEREVEHCQRLATLGTLAASVAHEFNNLLTPIVSYAQMALHTPPEDDMVAKALRKAIEGAEKASGIASSMLGFIRDEDDGCVHVGHALRDALGCLARDPAKDGIRLTVDVGPECWVRMRPVAMEQVLLNLILNARAAMMPSGGALTIRGWCSTWNAPAPPTAPEAGWEPGHTTGGDADIVEIEVSDTGCGMTHELIARAFEPFVRDRARGVASTGLGLSICRRLIEEAGGSIKVESEEGAGTRFLIRLPQADPAGVGAADGTTSAEGDAGSGSQAA